MWSSTSVLWSTVNLVFPFRKVSDSATTGAAARIRIHPVKHTSRKTTVQTVKRTEQREKYVGGGRRVWIAQKFKLRGDSWEWVPNISQTRNPVLMEKPACNKED